VVFAYLFQKLRIQNFLNRSLRYYTKTSNINLIDEITGEKYSIVDLIVNLNERIENLEKENTNLTNALYEIENRIQSKIDNIHPVVYNLKNYSLGDH
jgi:predicted  nucleic acid-binding Zn-ribbon protein